MDDQEYNLRYRKKQYADMAGMFFLIALFSVPLSLGATFLAYQKQWGWGFPVIFAVIHAGLWLLSCWVIYCRDDHALKK